MIDLNKKLSSVLRKPNHEINYGFDFFFFQTSFVISYL